MWYQVLVSRFCNGDPANDPPGTVPWDADWAARLPGEQPNVRDRLLGRRYGGDMAGLRSQLAYLHGLGVNVVYLNPVFQAPSDHKYDTADHRHIDASYGQSGSGPSVVRESADPSTWGWTASDRQFLSFLAEAHRLGMRVVIDGVFNHVGRDFWAWRDVMAHGCKSLYGNWFDVTAWGPPLHWRAWDGPNGELPCFRRIGDRLDPSVEAYVFAVVQRWMDPNGDGDPSDGIDGWRLDAAEQVPHGFWRRFRGRVKAINPDAIIIGEIWGDARPWLGGDQFDVVTNYPFAASVLRFFTQDNRGYSAGGLRDDLMNLVGDHPWSVTTGMLNLLGSHDTERAVTALTDPQRRVREPGESADTIPRRDNLVPDENAYRRLGLAVVFQYVWPGAPITYYGDERGQYGGDDPFCRGPMRWADSDRPELAELYRRLASLRHELPVMRRGAVTVLVADDVSRVLAILRWGDGSRMIGLFNGDEEPHVVRLNAGIAETHFRLFPLVGSPPSVGPEREIGPQLARSREDGSLRLTVAPLSATLLLAQPWGLPGAAPVGKAWN